MSRREMIIETLSGIGVVLIMAAMGVILFMGWVSAPYPYV